MRMMSMLGEPIGQGWPQLLDLTFALVLAALIGLERELRHRSAGLRTHTLIGFGAALIMLVSKYGFTDVLGDHVVLDPSRVAAQIVSGIGFIGGGLIFVKRDLVRGLTTAAAVWLTTAVGMAAGAGLPVLAIAAVAGYFVVAYAFTPLSHHLQHGRLYERFIELSYEDGRGLLRRILAVCTSRGYTIGSLTSRRPEFVIAGPRFGHGGRDLGGNGHDLPTVSVVIGLRGADGYQRLVAELGELDGVLSVGAIDPADADPESD